mgnify:CR=1 FL=1
MVLKAKKYIKKGDIFQVVLSQRFETKITKAPLEIYKKLRITNPSPSSTSYQAGFRIETTREEISLMYSSPTVLRGLLS